MKIALCICTYKRSELLERLLRSLQNIQLGELERGDVRIIVVDNYPDGSAQAVCERVSGRLPLKLDFVEEKQRGKSFARNRAIEEALQCEADFIAFLDDDDLPEPDWLWQLAAQRMQTHADIVYGVFPPLVDPNWPDWLKNCPLFDEPGYKDKTKYGAPNRVATCNVLISRELIERMKSSGPPFLNEFGMIHCEDTEFFTRAAKHGATFRLSEKAIIKRNYEEQRLTVSNVLMEAFRKGNCIRKLLDKYGTSAQRKRRKNKAFKKLLLAFLSLPLRVYSMTRLVRSLYQMSTELGVLRGYDGKK